MSFRTIIIVGLALLFGLSAAVGVNLLLQESAVQKAQVVVALESIPKGHILTAKNVKFQERPESLVLPGTVRNIEEVVNRVTAVPLIQNEEILEHKLMPKNSVLGLAARVPKNMRAMTLQTPHLSSGVGGLIQPGNKVDVLLTMGGTNAASGGRSTNTLLQNVEVLAVDQKLDNSPDLKSESRNAQSVTLLVTPDDANKLDLGQTSGGDLHLILRNNDDSEVSKTKRVSMRELQGLPPESPWYGQTKAILDSLGKWMENSESKKPNQVAAGPSEAKNMQNLPIRMEIRTLRGVVPGVVPLEIGSEVANGKQGGGF